MKIPGKENQAMKDARILAEVNYEMRTTAKAKVNAHREQVLKTGFPFMEKRIQSDDRSRSNFTEYLIKKDVIPYPVNWKTADNSYLLLEDADTVELMSNYMMQFFGAETEVAFYVLDIIDKSTDQEEIDAVVEGYLNS